jgi:hypothetical protein
MELAVMRSGVRTPSGPNIQKELRPGCFPGLCRVGDFGGTTTLLHHRVNLFLFLRSEYLDLCTVVRFQLGEVVLKALRCRVDVSLRNKNTGVAGDLLDREGIGSGLTETCQKRVSEVVNTESSSRRPGARIAAVRFSKRLSLNPRR